MKKDESTKTTRGTVLDAIEKLAEEISPVLGPIKTAELMLPVFSALQMHLAEYDASRIILGLLERLHSLEIARQAAEQPEGMLQEEYINGRLDLELSTMQRIVLLTVSEQTASDLRSPLNAFCERLRQQTFDALQQAGRSGKPS
ncbi:hypothetical protein AA0242T_0034 [Acetobacter aceti NRIC 0242]|uniref:Uncharacterized protein n=1 Tax=Acetobacter aceti NBRC 14818 TaxID=887700 RepID=A0AB33I9J6_ACEAC|nr:hypothetical protein [Acetobacter aceti]TCS35462.1 hypothetical protein EDC15_101261 [Acetobacter aceti NBRC 14818]BCK75150.1 hypothetical protein EMQ_0756 [Acetobacter aceti NBRC 14818]GAN57560.1 hypothetical protein Abac_017_261 [Acetobacter aceti NBRC 14818]GBO79332.1 hypothetical protein AA0242T_0034 [Acetobacter aceti NRIC 0242]